MILKPLGIKHLVVTGCTTSVCVESAVRNAMFRDYTCLLLQDCLKEPIAAELSRSNHEASLLVLQLNFAWVSDSCFCKRKGAARRTEQDSRKEW